MYNDKDTGICLLLGMRLDGAEKRADRERERLEIAAETYIERRGASYAEEIREGMELMGEAIDPSDPELIAEWGEQCVERAEVVSQLVMTREAECECETLAHWYRVAKESE